MASPNYRIDKTRQMIVKLYENRLLYFHGSSTTKPLLTNDEFVCPHRKLKVDCFVIRTTISDTNCNWFDRDKKADRNEATTNFALQASFAIKLVVIVVGKQMFCHINSVTNKICLVSFLFVTN